MPRRPTEKTAIYSSLILAYKYNYAHIKKTIYLSYYLPAYDSPVMYRGAARSSGNLA